MNQFKVMTWNILEDMWIDPLDDNYLHAFPDKSRLFFEKRVKAIVKQIYLNNPDVICLSEVSYRSMRILKTHLQENYIFSKLGYHINDYWKDTYKNTNLTNYAKNGNCTLVKKGGIITKQESIVLSNHGNVGLLCEIKIKNKKYWIMNVHLENRYKTYRKIQLTNLSKILKKLDGNIIVCGDFNSDKDEHQPILKLDFIDLNNQEPTFFIDNLILDKIYFKISNSISTKLINKYRHYKLKSIIEKMGSDHFYLILQIQY